MESIFLKLGLPIDIIHIIINSVSDKACLHCDRCHQTVLSLQEKPLLKFGSKTTWWIDNNIMSSEYGYTIEIDQPNSSAIKEVKGYTGCDYIDDETYLFNSTTNQFFENKTKQYVMLLPYFRNDNQTCCIFCRATKKKMKEIMSFWHKNTRMNKHSYRIEK